MILLPPLAGWLRFDLWGGNHYYGGEQVSLTEALSAFVIPFFLINAVILVLTHQAGRYLCGWVCPTGVVIRWAEHLEVRFKDRPYLYNALLALISLVMAGGVLLWWVDLKVYTEGSARARALTGLAQGLLAGAIFFEMKVLRFTFCQKLCPSGIYFAILGQRSKTGIKLEESEDRACIDCGVCDDVCPVDLPPRTLLSEPIPAQGLYFQGMSNLSLCLRCGDCVNACDQIFDKKGGVGVLAMTQDEAFEEPVEAPREAGGA